MYKKISHWDPVQFPIYINVFIHPFNNQDMAQVQFVMLHLNGFEFRVFTSS